jgi:hypothetical protein
MGLWVLNVGNMQSIQSGFYLLLDKVFEIIRNISGQLLSVVRLNKKQFPHLNVYPAKEVSLHSLRRRFMMLNKGIA